MFGKYVRYQMCISCSFVLLLFNSTLTPIVVITTIGVNVELNRSRTKEQVIKILYRTYLPNIQIGKKYEEIERS